MRLLQVEDNAGEAHLLAEAVTVSQADISVDVAPNGLRAIEHLHQASEGTHDVPDLILLDLNMPVMDGLSFLRVRAQHDAMLVIPVVVLVSSLKSPTVAQVIALGASVIQKPGTFDGYLALARRLARFPALDPTPVPGHPIIGQA